MISTMNILSGKQITLSPKQFFMSLLKSSKMKSPIVKQTNYISPQWFLHTVKLNSFSNSTSLFSQPDFFKQLLKQFKQQLNTMSKCPRQEKSQDFQTGIFISICYFCLKLLHFLAQILIIRSLILMRSKHLYFTPNVTTKFAFFTHFLYIRNFTSKQIHKKQWGTCYEFRYD